MQAPDDKTPTPNGSSNQNRHGAELRASNRVRNQLIVYDHQPKTAWDDPSPQDSRARNIVLVLNLTPP